MSEKSANLVADAVNMFPGTKKKIFNNDDDDEDDDSSDSDVPPKPVVIVPTNKYLTEYTHHKNVSELLKNYPLGPEVIEAINQKYGNNYCFIVIKGINLEKEGNFLCHFSYTVSCTYKNHSLLYPTYRFLEEDDANSFWDHRIISVNTVRKAGMGGGGKTPNEMLDDMKKRHASGAFVDIVPQSVTWGNFEKQLPIRINDFQCVRIQRIVATHPNIDYYIDLMDI